MINAGKVVIADRFYTVEEIHRAAVSDLPIQLTPDVLTAIDKGRALVMELAESAQLSYGINTGFGTLCTTRIPKAELSTLQHRHLLSHACGVGTPAPEVISRLAVLIKLLTFSTGHSGISRETVGRMIDLWNCGAVGAIPQKGTVGASGDLAPLAHLALPLIGRGELWWRGDVRPAGQVLSSLGFAPIALGPKEGLCLTNGVQYINAYGVLAMVRARRLLKLADLCAAFSTQAYCAARTFYDPLVHGTSQHPERRTSARNIAEFAAGSNHFELPQCNSAQEDPYSFRCAPQVHAAARQTIGFATSLIERECNSVSDNPLVFPAEGRLLTGGNLHGESTAFALDFSAIALTELSSISERRTYQLLSGTHGLPDFLVRKPGLNSGFMVVQYTSAALVNENKVLSTPASIDTIPTCQLQEDHVSMGGTSAYKLMTVLDNCETVLAVELLCACQAAELNPGLVLSGPGTALLLAFREQVPFVEDDVLMGELIHNAKAFLADSPHVQARMDSMD